MAVQKYKFKKSFFFNGVAHMQGSVIECDDKAAAVHVKLGNLEPAEKGDKINHITPAIQADIEAKKAEEAKAEAEDEKQSAFNAAVAAAVKEALKSDKK